MGVKISDLEAASGAALAMQFEVSYAGASQRLTLAQMFALSTGAVVADTPLLNLAQTWNNAAVAFTALKLNITNTASAAGSSLMDLQVGGVSKLKAARDGSLAGPYFGALICTAGFYTAAGGSAAAMFNDYGGLVLMGGGTVGAHLIPSAFRLGTAHSLGWTDGTASAGVSDLTLFRDTANTLALRNGANAQSFRCYNTFTDASNYERVSAGWAANAYTLGFEYSGTGSRRNMNLGGQCAELIFQSYGSAKWKVESGNGHFFAATDNTYDIGATASGRPRNGYLAGFLQCSYIQTQNQISVGYGSGASILYTIANGVLRLTDNTSLDFKRLLWGGETASYPSLKRNAATLECRLADDSADTDFKAARLTGSALTVNDEVSGPGTSGVVSDIGPDPSKVGNGSYLLSAPATWLRVTIGGNEYKIPVY